MLWAHLSIPLQNLLKVPYLLKALKQSFESSNSCELCYWNQLDGLVFLYYWLKARFERKSFSKSQLNKLKANSSKKAKSLSIIKKQGQQLLHFLSSNITFSSSKLYKIQWKASIECKFHFQCYFNQHLHEFIFPSHCKDVAIKALKNQLKAEG